MKSPEFLTLHFREHVVYDGTVFILDLGPHRAGFICFIVASFILINSHFRF